MDGFTEQPDVFDYRPAVVATGIWLGVGLALDAYLLVKRKDRLISDVLRTPAGKALLIVFGLHIVNRLGKMDPFRACASIINGRINAAADAAVSALTDALPGE